jgi:hypothetical protein
MHPTRTMAAGTTVPTLEACLACDPWSVTVKVLAQIGITIPSKCAFS